MSTHWSTELNQFDPCDDALAWARTQPSAEVAWQSCPRGNWMLWLLGHLSGEVGSPACRKLVLAACACARTALCYVPKCENRPRIAIETAEAYARGDAGVTLSMVDSAARAAYAAEYAAEYAAAYAAAYAARAAARAAAYATHAAADAAYAAASAAAYAASAAEYAAAGTNCACIVREHYPHAPVITEAAK